jgi:hypothetical protein
MAIQTEPVHATEFILCEGCDEGSLSRESITVLSGQDLVTGTVLGKITASGKYKAYNNGASDGSEVAAGILYAACDASDGDKAAVAIVRLAEVASARLTGLDANATTDLKALNIIVR